MRGGYQASGVIRRGRLKAAKKKKKNYQRVGGKEQIVPT